MFWKLQNYVDVKFNNEEGMKHILDMVSNGTYTVVHYGIYKNGTHKCISKKKCRYTVREMVSK